MLRAGDWIDDIGRGWWAGLLIALATVFLAGLLGSRQPRVYRSSGTVLVGPDAALVETTDLLRSLEALERRTILATFAELAQSPGVRAAAAERIELSPGDASLFSVRASVLPSTNILRISVEGPEPVHASLLAAAAAGVLAEEAQRLYRPFSIQPLAEPPVSRQPVSPQPRRILIVSLVLGLFLGVATAYGVGRLASMGLLRVSVRVPARIHAE